MPRKKTLAPGVREAILKMPVDDLLRLRLDPLVEVVYRRHGPRIHQQVLSSVSRVLIEIALRKTAENASQAAEILGISRNTLARHAGARNREEP